ncbi:hypothetical protein [uncultured Microbacterium sp.]|uniref:hypothetical protein n=1 Tax=uncultured Microbacterium sp. TaxID=191216 RepID=UPI00345A956D
MMPCSSIPLGVSSMFSVAERAALDGGVLTHRIPTDADAAALAGGHVVVVGAGHSAATTIVTLAEAARRAPGMRVSWVLRRGTVGDTFGGGDADELPARGALGLRAKAAVEDGTVQLVSGFRTEQVALDGGRAVLVAEDGRALDPADRVVVLTGFRPDLSFLSEVRLDLDYRMQAVRAIAADVDPNLHSCGSVRATGAVDLVQPEPGFYLVGAKSYGRAPTFLAMTGYEQVRSIAAELAGDHEAAARIELALPDTGVCGGSGVFDDPDAAGGSCCAPAAPAVSIGDRAPLTLLG